MKPRLPILLWVLAACAGVAVAAELAGSAYERWWPPVSGKGGVFPAELSYGNEHGTVTTLNVLGPLREADNAFFLPIGRNGRACVTCHQPADGMSVSLNTIRQRWQDTNGRDPLFAMSDGANCPHLPPAERASHSLLLDRGLFRVSRPWPPRQHDGSVIEPDFTIEVVRDPTGCNRHPQYGLQAAQPMISVYRRPRPATNIKYLVEYGFPFEPKNGLPLPRDPETGLPTSGNLMADARARTLKAQAIDALITHMDFERAPSAEQLRQIISFESSLYTAQSHDRWGAPLTALGAQGGPAMLRDARATELQGTQAPIWREFFAWDQLPPAAAGENAEQRAFRASVARGAHLFSERQFLVSDSAGVNNMGFGNPVLNPCAFCHNMQRTGMDVAPGQVDLGTTNSPHADPSPELPLFKLTCRADKPHPHLGQVVYTQDPGYALTTGKCIDIGKITIQQMRGLAARAPYFSNGSAQTLRDIVDFYDRRYQMNLSEQDKQDLTNLMSVL